MDHELEVGKLEPEPELRKAMSEDLLSQIHGLRKIKWVDLQGLVACAEERLLKTTCVSISLLGRGSYNTVYKLAFSDGTEYAASVSNYHEEDFVPSSKESEVATMFFVRESGLYPDIPVPQIHAWDLTFANPVCAPYVIMDVVEGVQLNDLEDGRGLRGLDAMGPKEQLSVVKSLAEVQAYLSKPVAFSQVGSLTRSANGEFGVGTLMTMTDQSMGGPYSSISELWRELLEREVLHALEEWHSLETDQLSRSPSEPKSTPQQFSEVLQLLSALISHFVPPASYSHLVLHHPDLALRNVLFDPVDRTTITGILDWDGAQILPLMLSAQFPDDLSSEGDDPYTHPGYPDEGWRSVPHDWTSRAHSSLRPENCTPDLTVRASAMVRRYYLRQYFSSCYAQQMAEIHNDNDLARATLFADAPYYLKFHEVLTRGWTGWIEHAAWIRETYWRLRVAGHKPGAVIVGPNTYSGSVEALVCDLALLETSALEVKEENEGLENDRDS